MWSESDNEELPLCPICGNNFVENQMCPHVLEFPGYCVDGEPEGDGAWVHLYDVCKSLIDEMLDQGIEDLSQVVPPQHLRWFDGDSVNLGVLEDHVGAYIRKLRGYRGAVSYETDGPPSDYVTLLICEEPKAAMKQLDEMLEPDLQVLEDALERLRDQ